MRTANPLAEAKCLICKLTVHYSNVLYYCNCKRIKSRHVSHCLTLSYCVLVVTIGLKVSFHSVRHPANFLLCALQPACGLC